ncbi:DNA-binding protein [Alloalcanivorax gelatiniphagus]|uniref:DNA-binding protein n=1 Tax=Alloalcanivorax gelatiniphagus TaxID=1194167 RepID=A0ABY2XPW7_9GAMM|nr:DNA-binding protein [Alloalcanivorax gelatiniphagus]TMW13746.1 DNA-binding protein [Alloalcanivorax gelatiniphagus]
MGEVYEDALKRLSDMGVTPLLGGLVPECATADLLGYSQSWFRQRAAAGQAVLPYVPRGNRRFYKLKDIVRFVTETAG